METRNTTYRDVIALGWDVDYSNDNFQKDGHCQYRASQGGFKTLWRPSIAQVLKDVQAIKQARETCKAPF